MIRGNELGHKDVDLLPRLQAQWDETKSYNVQATWLWQPDALTNRNLTDYAKSNLQNQEFGLFLEYGPRSANTSGVQYRGRGLWYFSDGLFELSYDPIERKKLVDSSFGIFKQTFGYYPKTVGAWWIDGPMLNYLRKTYGITSTLRAADQYNLDVYSIWGTPWSIPYLASTTNAGIPARSSDQSSNVVVMQWAARDPVRGYGDSRDASVHSFQDYQKIGFENTYFNYLASVFLRHPGDQIVVGLENDEDEKTFIPGGHYDDLVRGATDLEKSGKAKIQLAKDYAADFLASKQILQPTKYFLTKDYLSNDQTFWYNSPNFRIGIKKEGDTVSLIDYRDYRQKVSEEYNYLPNSNGDLRIYIPEVIDSATLPQQKKLLITSNAPLVAQEKDGVVTLSAGEQQIGTFSQEKFEIKSVNQPEVKSMMVSVFTWIGLIYFAYLVIYYFRRKNIKKFLLSDAIIFVPLLIAIPYLSSGYLHDLTFVFDKKQLFLSPFLTLIPLPPAEKIIIVFQILPFIVLLFAHILSSLRPKSQLTAGIYLLVWLAVLTLFLHVPYFPLDRSTIKVAGIGGTIVGIIGVVACAMLYLKTKSKQLLLNSFATLVLVGVISGITIFLSRATYVITPFEMRALEFVYHKKLPVTYVPTPDKPIYKAVKPALFEDFTLGAKISGVEWTASELAKNSLFIVPRYLGTYLPDEKIKKENLSKIFDNFQIQIYEKK